MSFTPVFLLMYYVVFLLRAYFHILLKCHLWQSASVITSLVGITVRPQQKGAAEGLMSSLIPRGIVTSS